MKTRALMLGLWLTAGAVLLPGRSFAAADLPAEFGAANKFYAEGNYPAAAATYERTLQQMQDAGEVSPVLYFNDGNAEFKLGHLGKAIAAYRHAALVTPRDSEVLGNLDFVRNQVQGATVRPAKWQMWVDSLTLNEGACLTAVLFWITLALLTARQIRPALAPKLRGMTMAAACATLLAGAVLAVQTHAHFSSFTAVVTEANAVARSGPFADAQTAFPVHDGAELTVLDRHDNWLQVTDGSGKIGWLSRNQLELLPGA